MVDLKLYFLVVAVVAFLPGLGVGCALRWLGAKHLRFLRVWLVSILALFAVLILIFFIFGDAYSILAGDYVEWWDRFEWWDHYGGVVIHIIFFLGWPSFYLGLGLSFTRGFWARHILGLSLLALATAFFDLGLALSIRYPDLMSGPAFVIILLMLSAVPLTVAGVFLSVRPSSRWLALVTALAAFMLSLPAIVVPVAVFTFR